MYLLQYNPQNWLEMLCIVLLNATISNDAKALFMLESKDGIPNESKYSTTLPGITMSEMKWDPPWFDELRLIIKQFPAFSMSLSSFTLVRKMSQGKTPMKSIGFVVILYINFSI